MRRVLSLWLTMASMALPGMARAMEPEPTMALEIDVSALPQDGETEELRGLLLERQARILRDGGIALVEDVPDAAKIRVTVSRYGEGDVNYRFSVALLEGRETTVERTLTCDLCRDTELVTKVGEEVARVSGRFMYEREAAAGTKPDEPVEGDGTDPSQGQPLADHEGKRVGATGFAGIAALVAGTGVAVGGLILLAKKPDVRLAPDDLQVEEVTTHRRLGIGLSAAGAGVLATGIVLLVVDQTVLRRRRAKHHAVFVPTAAPNGFGVSLTGRF